MRERLTLSKGIELNSVAELKETDGIVKLPLSTILTEGEHNGITFLQEEIVKAKIPKVFPLTLDHSRSVADEVGWWEDARVELGKLRAVPVINLNTEKGKTALGYVKNRFSAGLIPEVSVEIWITPDKSDGKVIARDIELVKASLVDKGANSPEEGAGIGLQKIDLGYIPKNPSNYKKDPSGSWKRPRLSDFTNKSWDELSDGEKRRIASAFAWSKNNLPQAFGDLKLPHHRPDGTLVWSGVRSAMGALLGARGGVNIPAEDKKKVYAHLSAHYKEFDKTPPKVNFSEDGEILEVVFMEEEDKVIVEEKEEVKEELEEVKEIEEIKEEVNYEELYNTVTKEKEVLEAKIKVLEEQVEDLKARLTVYMEAEREALLSEIREYNPDFKGEGKDLEALRELADFVKGIKLTSGRKSLVVSPEKKEDPIIEYEMRIRRKIEELRRA